MPAVLAAACSLVLGAAGDPRLALGLRAEAQARRVEAAALSGETLDAAIITPSAALSIGGPELGATGRYAVDLREPDLARAAPVEAFRSGAARLELRPTRTARWFAAARLGYGTTDLLTQLARDTAGPLEPVAAWQQLRYLDAGTSVGVEADLDRRTVASLGADAFRNGGADAASRRLLPAVQGVSARARLAWNATREDVLTGRAEATVARAEGPTAAASYTLCIANWRHAIDAATEVFGGAGGWAGLRGTDGARGAAQHAAAEAGASARLGRAAQLRLTAAAHLAPLLDRYSGALAQAADVTTDATWQLDRAWVVAAGWRAAAFTTRALDRGASLLASASVGVRPAPWLTVALSATRLWQSADPVVAAPAYREFVASLLLAFAWDSAAGRVRVEAPRERAGDTPP